VPYKDAVAAAPRLRTLANDDIYLSDHTSYQASNKDLAALANSPAGSAEDFINRGNIYLNAQKFDDAINDFTQALKLEPDNVWALADRAVAHMWKREFDAGESDLAAAEARDANNPVIPRARGLRAELTGDCSKAVQLFTQSLTRAPSDAFSLGHRAACEAATSHPDEALADSAQALKINPDWLSLRLLRANILMRQGKRDLVAAEADAMIHENPGSDFAFVAAAKTYAAVGQTDKAMQAIDHALEIKPSAMVYVNRAYVRPKSDVSGRLADLNAALKLEPDNRDVLVAKASLIADQGDSAGALKLLEQVQPASANDVATLQRLALLQKLGRAHDERKLIDQLRASAKSDVELNNICWAKATAGIALDSALQDCQDALKLNPNNAPAYDSLGMVLLKLGRLAEALDAYNTAIAKGVGADSLMGRAFVYLKQGDRARADSDAAEARKRSPTIDSTFAGYGLKFDQPPPSHAAATKAPAIVSVTRE
jgi:tetratricopeptide (TPR) repeat protein